MLQFGDSMLPVGAFAFSSGVESAVQKGVVRDPETLRGYALTALEQAAKGDGVAIVWATRAALAGNIKELMRIDHEAFARKLNEETRLMTTRMGKKLAEMGAEITEDPLIARWRDAVREGRTPGTYPVSLAIMFVVTGLSTQAQLDAGLLHEVLTVHLYGVAMTILNASMRLMRITHIDIQRTLYGLTRHFDPLCRLSMQLSLEQMSAFAPMTDILAANHVKARVRLFMN
ncbi:MAG TPA: urease accessory protein UreF [Candidatus Bilophila faecipullorum]|uniref:Urease accessory protein UreF n=2 Tax=Bilophila TaxID=35832 RepID=A0A9D1R0C4_9BACT|nr:urease accessory protein UreF [Candidatus Bilophila faecipullorum]